MVCLCAHVVANDSAITSILLLLAVQVVAFQAMMELMAENFPGVFKGYKLRVAESHQRNKADTSGTAKAVVQSFKQMGVDFNEVCIPHQMDGEVAGYMVVLSSVSVACFMMARFQGQSMCIVYRLYCLVHCMQ